jgi:hypothetical protein
LANLLKHTRAHPEKPWEGFHATRYRLASRVTDLPLSHVIATQDGRQKEVPITLGAALVEGGWSGEPSKVAVRQVESDHIVGGPILFGTKVTTETGEVVFGGASFSRELLEILLDLAQAGINGFEVSWFWHDSDWSVDSDVYSFFLVHDNSIVRERVCLFDSHDSGFDPTVLQSDDHADPIWSDEQAWSEASTRFWYRRFYQETPTGRLMVLRPDEPVLHHYPEGRWRPELAFAFLQVRLARIELALWLIAVLAVCAVFLLWR